MRRMLIVGLNTILLLLLISSPAAAPLPDGEHREREQVINDVIADFAVLSAWLSDVYPHEGLLVSKCTNDLVSATKFLENGFGPDLAQSMAANWSEYVPEQGFLAIIPTDSIPILNAADRGHLSVRRISSDRAVVQRAYRDIYWPGDAYHYQIISDLENGRWIITEVQLLPLDYLP